MPFLDPVPVFLELKYCERCGGLWLRPRRGDAIYCAACSRLMRQLPPRRSPASDSSPPASAIPQGDPARCVVPSEGAPNRQQAQCWPAGWGAGTEGTCVVERPLEVLA